MLFPIVICFLMTSLFFLIWPEFNMNDQFCCFLLVKLFSFLVSLFLIFKSGQFYDFVIFEMILFFISLMFCLSLFVLIHTEFIRFSHSFVFTLTYWMLFNLRVEMLFHRIGSQMDWEPNLKIFGEAFTFVKDLFTNSLGLKLGFWVLETL